MGFRDRLADLIAPKPSLEAEYKAYLASMKASGQVIPLLSGLQQPNIPIYGDMTVAKAVREGYKISVYVYRAVRTIVQAGSAVPWIALDKKGEQIEGHDFEMLMKRPNKEMSGQDLIEFLFAHLLLPGNALWQPMIVNKRIKELWPVMPDLVHPVPSDQKGKWLKEWQVRDSQGSYYTVPPETFIHFMQFDPGNPYWGTGPLMAAARTIDTDNEAQDTQKISMQNRATPDGVFTHEAIMTPEQFAEANRQIKELRTAKTKRREPWVLGAGAKWQQMSLSPVEMDYIASRLSNKQDIAAAFGIDSWWLGDKSSSTYNNVSEARKALFELVVIPMLDDIKATMNLRIAPLYQDEEITISYDLSGIAALRDDYQKKVVSANQLWGMGVPMKQLNDVLEMGLEEFEGWDVSYLPFSVTPVSAIETEPPEPAPVIVQAPPPEEQEEKPDEDEEKPEAAEEDEDEDGKAGKKSLKFRVSDEYKSMFWKKVDTRRQAYWPVVLKRIKALYGAEGRAVAQVVAQNPADLMKETAVAIRSLRPQWEKTLEAVAKVILADFGTETALGLGAIAGKKTTWRFDPFSPAARAWLAAHISQSTTVILGTNMDTVSRLIEKGFAENMTTVEIGRELRQFYDTNAIFNSMRVARTEISSAAGFGQREAAEQSGVVKTKTWVSSRDDRVRDAHQPPLDGETVNLNEAYSNGLMYPGDSSGDPSEFIMCRCTEVYG